MSPRALRSSSRYLSASRLRIVGSIEQAAYLTYPLAWMGRLSVPGAGEQVVRTRRGSSTGASSVINGSMASVKGMPAVRRVCRDQGGAAVVREDLVGRLEGAKNPPGRREPRQGRHAPV